MPARLTTAARSRPLPSLALVLKGIAQVLARWNDRRATRRALSKLDAHMIRDIGLTPNAQSEECDKPFWRD